MLVDAAARQRDIAALEEYAPLAEERAARYEHKLYQAIAQRAWGVAHRLRGAYPEAESRLYQALEMFEELGTRWQIGRTLFELGELELDRSNPGRAREYFSQAMNAFEEVQAAPDEESTRVRLGMLEGHE
jgi:hypothetical protein